ncbi:MAG: ribbon-helix-helix domain-containing protein [Actinomycetota bacterium]|nr:ribbon-helix-helix domain-containing protein [Actinomycetota bacterium]
MKRTQIYLDEDQTTRLDERAAARATTRSELIRQAVHAYLDENTGDEAARLARFRAAVDEAFGSAPDLPRGEDYVRELRTVDLARDRELERRRRG